MFLQNSSNRACRSWTLVLFPIGCRSLQDFLKILQYVLTVLLTLQAFRLKGRLAHATSYTKKNEFPHFLEFGQHNTNHVPKILIIRVILNTVRLNFERQEKM